MAKEGTTKDRKKEKGSQNRSHSYLRTILKERINMYSSPIIEHVERKVIREVKYQTKPVRRINLIETIVSIFALLFSGVIVFIFRKKIYLSLK